MLGDLPDTKTPTAPPHPHKYCQELIEKTRSRRKVVATKVLRLPRRTRGNAPPPPESLKNRPGLVCKYY